MKIAVDCSHHLIRGGICAYIENLVYALTDIEPENEYLLYYRLKNRENDDLPYRVKAQKINIFFPRRVLSFLENTFSFPPLEIWTGNVDVIHGTHFSLPVSKKARKILTVHDLGYLKNPDFYNNKTMNEYGYNYLLRNSLKRTDIVLAISHSTKRDLIEILGFPEDRIWVVPYGADIRFQKLSFEQIKPFLERNNLTRPYILYPIGTIDSRKNLLRTIQAYSSAFPNKKDRPILFLAGVGIPDNAVMELVSTLNLKDDIIIRQLSYPDELSAVMNGAQLGIYPSLYEGFGLPPLEAMACGLPMIVSNISSVPEVIGDAGIKVDPYNTEEISDAIKKLYNNVELQEKYRLTGLDRAHSEKFSWIRTAKQTYAAYCGNYELYCKEDQPLIDFNNGSSK